MEEGVEGLCGASWSRWSAVSGACSCQKKNSGVGMPLTNGSKIWSYSSPKEFSSLPLVPSMGQCWDKLLLIFFNFNIGSF